MPADPLAVLLPLLPLPFTVPAALIDLRRRIIPDGLTFGLLVTGLGVAVWRDPDPAVLAARLAAAAAFGFAWTLRALHARLRGRIGLGLGDVKFLGAAAAWTGLAPVPLLLLVASLTALAVLALAALVGRRIDARTRLPFGPFLAIGLHVALTASP